MNLNRLAMIAENECRLTRTRPILLGVSGGPDSLCLMDALTKLNFQVLIAHFDHQLRAESLQDSALVRSMAESRGLSFFLGSQNVADFAIKQHLSIEEAARVLRYRFLFSLARDLHVQAVVVGHTADDQVETVLMHFLRGSGLAGLKGMSYISIHQDWDPTIPLVRPLLSFWREDTVAYCQDQGLVPVQDASNLDMTYLRNRLRHELIPYLETYNPQIRKALWRMSQVIAGAEAVVKQSLDSAWQKSLISQSENRVVLDLEEVRALPTGLFGALLRKAIPMLVGSLRDVDYDAIDRAGVLLGNVTSMQINLGQGLLMFREADTLVIKKALVKPEDTGWPQVDYDDERELEIPGFINLCWGWRLSACWVQESDIPPLESLSSASPWEIWLAADEMKELPHLRRPRPGDRFQPFGMQGHTIKLSDFWINQKQPRRARTFWPLILIGGKIAWIPGFRQAEQYRLKKNTRKALHLRVYRVQDNNTD